MKNIGLHRFAVFAACCTFCLIIAGGLVTSTDSGLAVPDWPLSYGQLMPPMVGGIFYEHGHRMVATFVGLLTVILAIWLWRKEDRHWVRNLGVIALLAVIIQGVLGGLTVLYLLPTPISVTHATLAQSFFSLMIFIALVTSPWWRSHQPSELGSIARTRRFAVLATSAVFLQLVLGALMRHMQAGMAIPDFPLSYGHLLPPLHVSEMNAINEYRAGWDLAPVTFDQIWIHFAHRVGALLATVLLTANVVHILRNYTERRLREPALVTLVLVFVQVLLGALTVWTGKGVQVSTAHVATGALLLGMNVLIVGRTFHLYRLPARSSLVEIPAEASRA